MARNNMSLEALKAHLFETLEGVKNNNDPEADDTEKVSAQDAKSIVGLANSIIDIYKLQVDAVKAFCGMDNVNNQGSLLLGMGIVSDDERKILGN